MVYTPGSQSRNWSAFVEPITTRRQIFHLVKSEPQKVVNGKIEPPVDYEVELVFHKLERDGVGAPLLPR